jgi:hypothetical protein
MARKRLKQRGSSDLSAAQIYEIHAFVPGLGFKGLSYSAESTEQALHRFKAEHPSGYTFRVARMRGKALSGPQARYLVWWKSYGGTDWEPHMIFVLDSTSALVGSVPEIGQIERKFAWDLATRRVAEASKHRLEPVDESTASLIGNEISVRMSRERDKLLADWEAGKFDQLEVEQGPELAGLRNIPIPSDTPRPEIWTLEGVIQAVWEGFTFGLPFILGESLFTPNAYWIGGQQYVAFLLTVGPEHTPELAILADGWMRVKLHFQPNMVPSRTWIAPPNESGVVSVYAEIDPKTVDWDSLNKSR